MQNKEIYNRILFAVLPVGIIFRSIPHKLLTSIPNDYKFRPDDYVYFDQEYVISMDEYRMHKCKHNLKVEKPFLLPRWYIDKFLELIQKAEDIKIMLEQDGQHFKLNINNVIQTIIPDPTMYPDYRLIHPDYNLGISDNKQRGYKFVTTIDLTKHRKVVLEFTEMVSKMLNFDAPLFVSGCDVLTLSSPTKQFNLEINIYDAIRFASKLRRACIDVRHLRDVLILLEEDSVTWRIYRYFENERGVIREYEVYAHVFKLGNCEALVHCRNLEKILSLV